MRIVIKLLLYCLILAGCDADSTKIKYGSNNGKQVLINGKKIYYEEYGHGPVLLLLSGGGLSRSIKDFEKVIPELAKHYRVIAPDSPGQGRSELADTLTYNVLLDYMSQFIDEVEIDSAYLIGWSDGGITGILLAERRPDKIRKVIAVGANNGVQRAVPSNITVDMVQPQTIMEFEADNRELIEAYTQKLPRDWKKLVNELNVMWYQWERYFPDAIYGRINIPVMIVLGDNDDIIIEHGLDMHRQIKGSQFCVLPNTTHEVFSEQPELINKISLDFFNK